MRKQIKTWVTFGAVYVVQHWESDDGFYRMEARMKTADFHLGAGL
jgi:hypothetical protein